MSQLVTYDGYCTWEQTDGSGNLWKITGDGSGTWRLFINSPGDVVLWMGTKIGTLGTLFGDTPEGTYTRTAGCDETATRDVAPVCVRMPSNANVCCVKYSALISGTGTPLDGLWTLAQYPSQFFWSSKVFGGNRPHHAGLSSWSSGDDHEMVLFSDGRQWILEINNVAEFCFPRWTARMSSTSCPPTTGWLYDQMGNNEGSVEVCPTPLLTVSTADCPTPESSGKSSSSSSSSSEGGLRELCGTVDTTFIWDVSPRCEPGLVLAGGCASTYLLSAPANGFTINMSSSLIAGVGFKTSTQIEGILVMVPAGHSVTQTWDSITGNPADPSTFTLPANSIIIENTEGYFCHKATGSTNASSQKTITQTGGPTLVIPAGSPSNDGTYGWSQLQTAGFTVVSPTAISKTLLTSLGFISGGVLSVNMYLITTGYSTIQSGLLTCYGT